jgi:glycosyltransferase involved in cell wall biosynthesis
MRIGYLIGQFPMPTHTFIWRDVLAIERLGVEVDLVSTRPPTSEVASHDWSGAAIGRTTYLDQAWWLLARSFAAAVVTGPTGLARCLALTRRMEARSWRSRLKIAALIPFGARLAALARERGWSHLHVPFPAHSAFVALYSRMLGGPRYSVGQHGTPEGFGFGSDLNLACKWRYADFGTAITARLAESLRAELPGSTPATILIAPMGVDVGRFARTTPYRPWDGRGPARLFSCGRGVPDKGHLDAVQAVAGLVGRGLDARLRIAGEFEPGGWYLGELQQAIRSLRLTDRVTLLGALPEAEVVRELEASHLFLLATHDEGLGVSIMEAMAMELPVVSTRVGGVPDLVEEGVQGLLVPPRDPGALAEALARILADPGLAASMSGRGRGKIAAGFTPERSARLFVDELHRRAGGPDDRRDTFFHPAGSTPSRIPE